MKIDFYLEQTLFKMLEKQDIDEIFVVDIIKATGVCKGTFYKYYRDKYDCLVHCFERFIYKDIDKAESWHDFLTKILDAFSKNSSVIINSFATKTGVNYVREYSEQLIGEMYNKHIKNTSGGGYAFLSALG